MNKVVVDAVKQGGIFLLACRACGPLGADNTQASAMKSARDHLIEHNCTPDSIVERPPV